MAKEISHSWMGRPITDPEHASHLETVAAINEFNGGKPKHEAEDAAYDDYKKDQLHESAAHHLNGVKSALAVGDHDSAKRHGLMYGLAMKKLGHDITGEPPPEVANKAKHPESSYHKFRAHKADAFVLPEKEEEKTTS